MAQIARSIFWIVALLVGLSTLSTSLTAQVHKTVTLRMVDSKTGNLIATSNFLVRVNRQETVHGDWVHPNDSGTGELTLPADAAELSIHATYEASMSTYVNCDADRDRGSSEHAASLDRWYSVEKILSSGVVAPNNCIGKKVPEKLQVIANPGEFVFFVRPMNSIERVRE